MKKNSISSLFVLLILNTLSSFAMDNYINKETNIDSILKIKPPIKYEENLKYQEINKYTESKSSDKKSNYDFGVNVDINKELRTIDALKLDVGTNF
jgi:hypothetical protein